jgi:hypothetical protein
MVSQWSIVIENIHPVSQFNGTDESARLKLLCFLPQPAASQFAAALAMASTTAIFSLNSIEIV